MSHDPLRVNSMIDSCAFDPKYEPEASASEELLRLADDGVFSMNVAHSTLKEIDHTNTPVDVKARASERNFSLPVELTPDERRTQTEIHRILTGKGKPENVSEDAEHVFEAQKYGGFFVTTDKRILDRAAELNHLCGIQVVKPSQFLSEVQRAQADERRA